jgi:hypothetical protein
LQEFFPLHPLSPDLQPPLPLQVFLPLQELLSVALSAKETPGCVICVPLFSLAFAWEARMPLVRPAIAAPAINALGVFIVRCSVSVFVLFFLKRSSIRDQCFNFI